jgi:hypothetical protein
MIHKTQSQHNNHYTESIPTPRLQLPSTHQSRIAPIHEEMEKNFLICEMLQQKICRPTSPSRRPCGHPRGGCYKTNTGKVVCKIKGFT